MSEPVQVKIHGHPHAHKLKSRQVATKDTYHDAGLLGETGMGMVRRSVSDHNLPAATAIPVTTGSTAPVVLPDAAVVGRTSLAQDVEMGRMTKLRELAEVADKHLVEIITPDGTCIKPMRATLEQVQTIQEAKTRRQRQSRVLVCSIS